MSGKNLLLNLYLSRPIFIVTVFIGITWYSSLFPTYLYSQVYCCRVLKWLNEVSKWGSETYPTKNMWNRGRPLSSLVLTSYLKQCNEPPWTSYFVKYSSVINDQRGQSHFNWEVGKSNYHVLRTGCYPYIKYHCTKRPYQDLSLDNSLMRFIKILNLGKWVLCDCPLLSCLTFRPTSH